MKELFNVTAIFESVGSGLLQELVDDLDARLGFHVALVYQDGQDFLTFEREEEAPVQKTSLESAITSAFERLGNAE